MAFGAVFVPMLQEPYYDFILVEYTPSGCLGKDKIKYDNNPEAFNNGFLKKQSK